MFVIKLNNYNYLKYSDYWPIFIVIITTFRSICPSAFFRRFMSNLRVHSISCSCGRIYEGETYLPLKVKLDEHRKTVYRGKIEKSGMTDHIWKEKGNHLPLWDQAKIIDREEHWKIRRLKQAVQLLYIYIYIYIQLIIIILYIYIYIYKNIVCRPCWLDQV